MSRIYVVKINSLNEEAEGLFALSPTRYKGVLAFPDSGGSGRNKFASSVDMPQSTGSGKLQMLALFSSRAEARKKIIGPLMRLFVPLTANCLPLI